MSDDITQKLRVTMPDFKGIEISCPCRIRSSLMTEAADKIERQARHIEELREKIDAEGSCACSFDGPGDICVAHSPALTRALAEVERLRTGLHRVSLASQNSMSSKNECGRIARETLEDKS